MADKITRAQALEAMRVIKRCCEEQVKCKDCVMLALDACEMSDKAPLSWQIPEE